MNRWRELNLNSSWDCPAVGALTVLRLTPKNEEVIPPSRNRYDVGRFTRDPKTGRKLWWHGTCSCEDPVRLKKRFKIIWCAIDDPDGFEYIE